MFQILIPFILVNNSNVSLKFPFRQCDHVLVQVNIISFNIGQKAS